jgi:hypothetical protein
MALVLILVFTAAGCATTWSPLKEGQQIPDASYKIEFPEGWLKFDSTMAKRMKDPLLRGTIITRDGDLLQRITVGHMELDTPLLSTKKTLTAEMLPQEAAEVIADNYRLTDGLMDISILENMPADVGEYPGFRLLMDMKLSNNMWKRMLFYGAIVKDRFYYIHYYAPRRHYFDRDEETFMAVVDSFRPVTPKETTSRY